MAISIRNMTQDDLPDVKGVDLLCWNDLIERSGGPKTRLSQRTDENVLSYFDANPEGAFVASDGNIGLVGTCFSHIWGRTGWVGPLSILPSYQAQGIGKELLIRSITHLEDSGCTDIGLETMPENATNMGMYLKKGFRPEGLVLILGKTLDLRELDEEPSGEVSIERYSESSIKEHLRSQVRRISNALRKGLDYSGELILTERFSLGETLIATSGGKVVGFSVVHTLPRRLSSPQASIRVLGVDPDLKSDALQPLLASSELMAADEGMGELTVAIPSVCKRALASVFSRYYTVTRSFERMMWSGSSGMDENASNLCSWSG